MAGTPSRPSQVEDWTVIVVTDHGQTAQSDRGPVMAEIVQRILELPPGPVGEDDVQILLGIHEGDPFIA